jgi:hypothetical protein
MSDVLIEAASMVAICALVQAIVLAGCNLYCKKMMR